MKHWKIWALTGALVLSAGLLTACNGDDDGQDPVEGETTAPPAYSDVWISEDSPYRENVPTAMTELSELKGFSVSTPTSSDGEPLDIADYAVLVKQDPDTDTLTYKIFSFRTGEVTATFTESESDTAIVEYRITASTNTPTFKVTKSVDKRDETGSWENTKTYSLYDITGQELLQRKTNFTLTEDTAYYLLDWVVFENNIYTVNEETGALTYKGKMPFCPDSDDLIARTEQYLYFEGYTGSIAVYDYDFNLIASRILPAHTDNQNTFVLANGDVLVQYVTELHPDATEYDLYLWKNDHMLKYALVTEILAVADNTVRSLALPHVITDCVNGTAQDEDGDIRYEGDWAEGAENIVFATAIVNKQLSDSSNDYLIFSMANDGTMGQSYKLTDGQIGRAIPCGNGYYRVRTVFGTVITDAMGKVIANIDQMSISETVDQYYISEYCIYDAGLNIVCNFADENAELYGTVGNTVFVAYKADDKSGDYKIMAFRDGSKTEVYSYDADAVDQTYFGIDSLLELYYIGNVANEERTFYNGDGQKLGTLTGNRVMSYSRYNYDCILAEIETADGISFYLIK